MPKGPDGNGIIEGKMDTRRMHRFEKGLEAISVTGVVPFMGRGLLLKAIFRGVGHSSVG